MIFNVNEMFLLKSCLLPFKRALVFTIVLIGVSVFADDYEPTSAPRETVKLRTLAIFLGRYDGASLPFGEDDLTNLADVLMKDYGSETLLVYDHPVEENFEDNSEDRAKRAFEVKTTEWFDSLTSEDSALLILSGHGVKDSEGKYYFPMLNFKTAKEPFKTAAVPFAWIRKKFEESKAKSRLIVVDACYSGTSKNLDDLSDGSYSLARAFNDGYDSNVATLASSSCNQKSWIWGEKKRSLFLYWFADGLRGFADRDRDGKITLDELFQYVRVRVEAVSKNDATMELQTPVLWKGNKRQDFSLPRPVRKSDETIALGCETLKRRLAEYVESSGKTKYVLLVAPEFKTSSTEAVVDPSLYGRLPSVFADRFRSTLACYDEYDSTMRKVRVAGREESLELLQRKKISVEDLGFSAKDKLIKANVDATLNGGIERKSTNTVDLSWVLTDLKSGERLECFETVFLTSDELATQGASFTLPPSLSATDKNAFDEQRVVSEDGVVSRIVVEENEEIQAQLKNKSNPFEDESLPYGARIYARPVGSDEEFVLRNGRVKDGVYYVPLDQGEEFEICLTVDKRLFGADEQYVDECYARVLVDGLGVLSQLSDTLETPENVLPKKEKVFEEDDPSLAPRVDLKKARRFILKLSESEGEVKLTLEGFLNAKNGVGKRFLIGNVDQSWAARRNYADEIGLITVMFSIPKLLGVSREPIRGDNGGVVEGGVFTSNVTTEKITNEERTRVVFQIRYVSTEEFNKL